MAGRVIEFKQMHFWRIGQGCHDAPVASIEGRDKQSPVTFWGTLRFLGQVDGWQMAQFAILVEIIKVLRRETMRGVDLKTGQWRRRRSILRNGAEGKGCRSRWETRGGRRYGGWIAKSRRCLPERG